MFVTIINDCQDPNAVSRQITRAASFFGGSPCFVGVHSGAGAKDALADLQAAGNLIDVLDAGRGEKGVVLVNVAPRGKRGKKWRNGTPFGYFYYKNTLVVTTLDGLVLSLVKKLQLVETVYHVDIPTVVATMQEQGFVDEQTAEYLLETQFRSYEFTPRLAAYLLAGNTVPSEELDVAQIPDAPQAIWWIDNFGNAKSTVLLSELSAQLGDVVTTAFGDLPVYNRLKDVPDGEVALEVGSSGMDGNRFIEVVVQGESAAEKLHIGIGDTLL